LDQIDPALMDLTVVTSPFLDVTDFEFAFQPTEAAPLGLEFMQCSKLHRAYISHVYQAPRDHTLRRFRVKYMGSYIIAINKVTVFAPTDIDAILAPYINMDDPPSTITVTLAPERFPTRQDKATASRSNLHLRISKLRRIAAINMIGREGLSSQSYTDAVRLQESMITDDDV
jgi:hypothetical protein